MASAFASLVLPLHPKAPRQNIKRASTTYDARSRTTMLSIVTLLANQSPNSDSPRRLDRRASLHNPLIFVPASEVPIVLSEVHSVADDAVLHDTVSVSVSAPAPEPTPTPMSSNSPPFDSPTAPVPLEHTASRVSPHASLLEALEREQLQELHARGGFAGFTAQEIEGWVAAGRAQ